MVTASQTPVRSLCDPFVFDAVAVMGLILVVVEAGQVTE
jgi:hypothetical protein